MESRDRPDLHYDAIALSLHILTIVDIQMICRHGEGERVSLSAVLLLLARSRQLQSFTALSMVVFLSLCSWPLWMRRSLRLHVCLRLRTLPQ